MILEDKGGRRLRWTPSVAVRRINVTGNAGSGKSTLARLLSQELGLPLIEMDRIVWNPGWQPVGLEERLARLQPRLDSPGWILDGVSREGRQQADLVIFLDIPLWTCLWRCLKRSWKYRSRQRPGLPRDCPEWRIFLRMLRILLQFPSRTRSAILRDLRPERSLLYRCSPSFEELRRLLEQLKLGATQTWR